MRPTRQERSEDRARSTPQKAPDAGAPVSQAPTLHTLTRASQDTDPASPGLQGTASGTLHSDDLKALSWLPSRRAG